MGDDLVSLPLLCSLLVSRCEGTGPESMLTFLLFLSFTGKQPSWAQYVILLLDNCGIENSNSGEEMTD